MTRPRLTLIDLDDILPDDPPSANVQVPDLRVAHQPVLQPDGQTVSFELYVVVSVTDVVHVGRLAVKDGVALFVAGETPSVVNAIRRRLNESDSGAVC